MCVRPSLRGFPFPGRCSSVRNRGQTEPLAALLAVAIFCLALSLYAGQLSALQAQVGDDDDIGQVTIERVWGDVREDGVFDATEATLQERLHDDTLPDGRSVSVNVTYVDANGHVAIADSLFVASDETVTEASRHHPPSGDSTRYERPIAVELRPGDIRPGTLEVVVWE